MAGRYSSGIIRWFVSSLRLSSIFSNVNPKKRQRDRQSTTPRPATDSLSNARSMSLGAKIRLGVLLAILIPLSIYSYYYLGYTTSIAKIKRAMISYDDNEAIRQIKQLERSYGPNAETCFLKARSYRHLGDDIGFAQNIELAKQFGYSKNLLENESVLRQAQLGVLPDMEGKLTQMMIMPDVEFAEVASSMIYGLLAHQKTEDVFRVLKLWQQQAEEKDTPWVSYFFGMIAESQRDWLHATEALEAAIKANPNFVPAFKQLGFAYQNSNKTDMAIEAFRRYLKSIPNDPEVIAELATALVAVDKKEEALGLLEPLVESNDATIEMRLVVARIRLGSNEPRMAIDALGAVAANWPEDVAINTILSQANQRLGNDEVAEKHAKLAAESQSLLASIDARVGELQRGIDDTAQRRYELGHILLHKQSREEGRHWLNLALAKDESFLPAHEDLVIYYTRTKQPEMASMHQRYLNLRRGNP